MADAEEELRIPEQAPREATGQIDREQSEMVIPPATAQGTADLAAQTLSQSEQEVLAATVVKSLVSPEQQRAAAEGVVGALLAEAKQDLAATVVRSLDSTEQQKSAAEAVVGALPAEAKQDLAATVVRSLESPEERKAAAQSAFGVLSTTQQVQLAENVLGSPDAKTRRRLWYMVVATMIVALFFFGSMSFVLIYQRKAAEAPLALATTALGALVGLVATSPGTRRSD